LSENTSEFLPLQPQRKKKKTKDQLLEKGFYLLTACSNQAMNDECQHFWHMIAAGLKNYKDTVRCVIQNEIMGVFLSAKRGFYERCHHTHLHPNNPPQAHFPIVLPNIYPQSINPPPHSFPHLSILKTILRRHSVSTITQFFSKFSHRKHFASYDIFRGRY
jgi:hypothetical protein